MHFIAKSAILLMVLTFVSGCGNPQARLTDRATGAVGVGDVQNTGFGNSGPMTVAFSNETYTGTWVTVRDSNYASSGGGGTATLRSDQGNRLVCQFRYSLVTVTGVGTCQRQDGAVFDLQVI